MMRLNMTLIFLRSYLFFCLEHSLRFLRFARLCAGVYALDKRPSLPVLKETLCVGDERHRSTLPWLLVVPQTFVTVQVAYFIFSGSQ